MAPFLESELLMNAAVRNRSQDSIGGHAKMRLFLFTAFVVLGIAGPSNCVPAVAQLEGKPGAKTPSPNSTADSPAANRTRTKLLKVKVTVDFKDTTLREALKEFAAQVDMQMERPVMWTYAEGVLANQPVSYTCSNKPLDRALDEILKKLKLGYVLFSSNDHPRDGWVQITDGNERGIAKEPPASQADSLPIDEDESKAAARLKIAKALIAEDKLADAKAILMLVTNKYSKTKAAIEAKELLERLKK